MILLHSLQETPATTMYGSVSASHVCGWNVGHHSCQD